MPPPLVERVALEFIWILVLVLFIVFVVVSEQANNVELQAQQHAGRRVDGAHIDRAQQQQQQQQQFRNKKFLHLARRLWVDRARDVRRSFGQLSLTAMLNARLARRANFGSTL